MASPVRSRSPISGTSETAHAPATYHAGARREPARDARRKAAEKRRAYPIRMVPMRGRIRARSTHLPITSGMAARKEYLFVFEGELELRCENGKVFRLSHGDSLYFDGAVGHVCLSTGAKDARRSTGSSPRTSTSRAARKSALTGDVAMHTSTRA